MQNVQRIVLVDFGAQYTQLIARRVREANVFCEVVSYLTPLSEILDKKPVGIILSGGPASVLDADAPHIDPAIYEQGIPVLGICYGMQLTAYTLGGTVERAAQREYGRIPVDFDVSSPLFAGMKAQSVAWMSHTFHVTHAPEGYTSIAHSENCAFCAMANPEKRIYAVQFHPEVTHSEEGQKVIANFLYNVCGCTGDWTMSTFIDNAIASIREQVGPNGRVMLGLSGGVDSSVAAALISRAIGERLTCVYVDHGFMRKNETESVREVFTKQFPVNLVIVDARERFLTKLAGVSDPETKRKLIGGEFVYCFADEAKKLEDVEFLARFIRTSSSPARSRAARSSSRTTTSAVCRPMCARNSSAAWLSRCACSSRTKCAGSVRSWACRTTWSGVSRSPAPAWPSASWATSRPTNWKPFARATRFSARKSRWRALTATSTSISPC